jgi:hypothetical protein
MLTILFVIRRLQKALTFYHDPVYLAYNPYFSAYFFSRDSIFLSQQISQQCFSAGLSAQPNGAHVSSFKELSSTHSSSVLCKIRVWIQMKLRPRLDAPKS